MFKQQIGVVGMAVMGRNLALNIERALLNKSDFG
nr:NAD(P)-binding domain-containing protein [Escherichia coli]